MKAAIYTQYGPPEVVGVRDVATPTHKDSEILVRVRWTTICAADWRLRSARPAFVRLFTGLWRPKTQILGMEFSGTVASVGKVVTRFHGGEEVFGSTGFRFGCHAEYVCVPEDGASLKPVNMTLEEAAAVMFGGMTALYFLRKAEVRAGERVLIYGASSSTGVFAVQLAKWFEARVTGVCSTKNLELVKSLGADEVVDYTREDFSNAGRIYDVVFDAVGASGFARTGRSLKRGGRYVRVGLKGGMGAMVGSIFASLWMSATGAGKMVGGVTQGTAQDREFLKELIEAGSLRTVIDRRYRLEQIAEAHRYAEAGHKVGHLVVEVG